MFLPFFHPPLQLSARCLCCFYFLGQATSCDLYSYRSGRATSISLLNFHSSFFTRFSAASLALLRPSPTQQPERSFKNVNQIILLLCLKSSNNSKKKREERKSSNNSHCDQNKLQIPSFVLKTQPGPPLPLAHVFWPFWPSFVSSDAPG